MTVRTKSLLIIAVTLIGLISLLYASSRSILLTSFVQLENKSVERNVQRALLALSNEIAQLAAACEDWAYSDASYRFVQSGAPEFAPPTLTESTMLARRLSAVVFIDRYGQIAFSAALNLGTGQREALSSGLQNHLTAGSPLLAPITSSQPVSGIVMLPEGPMLAAALPVLTSARQGPAQGVLVIGRPLDQAQIQRLMESTRLLLMVQSLNVSPLSEEFERARGQLKGQDAVAVHPLDSKSVAGYGLYQDIYGNPALILRVDMYRDIYEQGQVSIWYFILALLSAGIVFGIMILLLLEQAVLSPLARLSASVNQIARSSDLSSRVLVSGKDELSRLAEAVNRMLEALQQSQKSVRDSEQRLRAVISNAPIIVYVLNKKGVFTLIEGRGLGDINPKEYLARPASDLFGGIADPDREGTGSLVGDVFVTTNDRYGLVFENRQLALVTAGGEMVGIIGVATDITERARAEAAEREQRRMAEALRDTAAALTGSLNLDVVLERILTNIGHVVPHDSVGILLVEGEFLRLAGARGLPDNGPLSARSYRYADLPLFREAMAAGEPVVVGDVQADSRWGMMPGVSPRTHAWIGIPLVARDVVIGLLSVASDRPDAYTRLDVEALGAFAQQAALAVENARILAELESSLTELREAQHHLVRTARLSAAGEIATGVAHQINNPLTTVIAEAHLLLQDCEPDDPRYESAAAIQEAAARAGAVVRRLLDLTRTQPYAMSPVHINQSLEGSIALIRAQIVPHIARLEVDLAPDLPPVEGSASHLEDLWINLLLNARDAVRDSGTGVIRVTSGLSPSQDAVQVTIQDNGRGIAAENVAHIFEPFFTTKDYGTGLGLAICQEVVTHHRGRIEVDSEEGAGTTFTITLPVSSEGPMQEM